MAERQSRLAIFVGVESDEVCAEEAGHEGGGEEEHGDDGDGFHGRGVLPGFVRDGVRGYGVPVGEEVIGLGRGTRVSCEAEVGKNTVK